MGNNQTQYPGNIDHSSRRSNQRLLTTLLCGVLVVLLGFAAWMLVSDSGPSGKLGDLAAHSDEVDPEAGARASTEIGPRLDGSPAGGDSVIGGVERPAKDLASGDAGASLEERVSEGRLDVGETPGVALDANEQTRAVTEAVRTGRYPERLTSGVVSETARSFDPGKFDPESDAYDEEYRHAYLRSPEPGRVWFPAEPGPGVPRIQPLSPGFVKVEQGEETTLRVSGVPGQPVTFTSFDLGLFENQLTTTTVVANDQGVAEAVFHGPTGTFDDVSIMAASPVMSGQVRLTVHVVPPYSGK